MEAFISLFSQYNVPAAFLVNIELTLWSALFSTILGVILVMMRISPVASLRMVSGAYVELFKNLPLTIIMVFMVLGAYAQLKLSFSDTFATNFFWLAVTGLSLYTASVATETSSLMSEMIEYRSDVIVPIFLIFAFGYVILIIPIGMLTTYLSNKLAVRR